MNDMLEFIDSLYPGYLEHKQVSSAISGKTTGRTFNFGYGANVKNAIEASNAAAQVIRKQRNQMREGDIANVRIHIKGDSKDRTIRYQIKNGKAVVIWSDVPKM